jgi:hypothetical protein
MTKISHLLDLSNPFMDTDKELIRHQENKDNWNKVVLYYFKKADLLAMRYWPGDLDVVEDDQISTKVYKKLLPFRIEDKPIGHGMNISYYTINSSVKDIILSNNSTDLMTDIFDFDLLSNTEVLLHSGDNGSNLLFNADQNSLDELLKITTKNSIIPYKITGISGMQELE